MRGRITATLVGLVVLTLLLAGAGTVLVSRVTARHNAISQLRREATVIGRAAARVHQPRVVRLVGRLLALDGGRLLVIGPDGSIETSLPSGITRSDIDPSRLLAGEVVTGVAGNGVFVAEPLRVDPAVRLLLPAGQPVLLLRRSVGDLLSSWAFLLLVAGITLLVAGGVAAWLSERISRPILEVRDATVAMAGGELSTRIPVRKGEVAELAALADSVNQMASSIEESRERERQMLLSVSHDLRSPLTSISGYAEAIEEGIAESPEQAAGVIRVAAARLERLVGDLLDLAKLDARALSFEIVPADARSIATAVVEALHHEAERRGVQLLGPAPGSPEGAGSDVTCDPDRLAQVITNLVENGLAFAQTSVRVGVERRPGPSGAEMVTVLVEDDGPGISPAELDLVFERFYRARTPGSSPRRGSGLGLAIVKELATAMEGRVWAESPIGPGGGTRMIVQLPAAPPACGIGT